MIDYNAVEPLPNILLSLGDRARRLRLHRNLTQKDLAKRSGVGIATIHRFEKTGRVSIENALRIASCLGTDDAFKKLFDVPPYATLDEVLERDKKLERKRATRVREKPKKK